MNYIELEPATPLLPDDVEGSVVAEGYDFEYRTADMKFSIKEHHPSGILALDPRPTPSSLNIIYPDNYEPYQFEKMGKLLFKLRSLVQIKKIRELQLLIPSQSRILDLGCGNGAFLRLLKSHNASRGWELHGNDLSEKCMEQLKLDGFYTHHCSCFDINLPQYFDAIILNQVIEHFADPLRILECCKRLLKPNGVLFIETPSTDGWDAKIFHSSYWGGYHFPRHFYLFNEANLKKILETHHYGIENVRYLASPAFWTQSLHHLLCDRGFKTIAKLCHLKNIPLTAVFTLLDITVSALGGKTSNMRVIARSSA